MTDLVHLTAGSLALDLAPAIGGAIAAFRHGEADLLRPMPADAIAKGLVRQSACFPLVPYSNRIAHGRFAWEGEAHQLTLNFGDHPHAIHGNGWQRAWTVAERDTASAALVLDHAPFGFGPAGWDGWPYAYRATQTFALTEGGLTVGLAIENRDARSMPAGLGWHPYFPDREGAVLGFQARDVWLNGADSLPARRVPVPPEWDYATPRQPEPGLDNCFNGWEGQATIRFPRRGLDLRLEADTRHLIVYVPPGRGFLAIEPVANMNDAVNRMGEPDHGLTVLAPGERLDIRMTLTVSVSS